MGYILPVANYQYAKYHMLQIQEKKNTYYIESPFKVVLDETYENQKKRQQQAMFYEKNYRKGVRAKRNKGDFIDSTI
ncbi:hypothetical protein ACLIBH_07825 [Virgibacillus sp. W0430]|uniref:hypothetical protein n=1 Tax=Virgibacillus sp. W0430 TaxID=3391580 RepID=UPI003F453495